MRKDKLLMVLFGLIISIFSFSASIFLFHKILDRMLLWQFESIILSVALRILLAITIFTILWRVIVGKLLTSVIHIIGIGYIMTLYAVVLFKSVGIRSINLNPFTIVADFSLVPFYILANFLLFIPVGIYLKYLLSKLKDQTICIYAILFAVLIEIIQYLFKLGVSDIVDVMMNGSGLATGIILYSVIGKKSRNRMQERNDTIG